MSFCHLLLWWRHHLVPVTKLAAKWLKPQVDVTNSLDSSCRVSSKELAHDVRVSQVFLLHLENEWFIEHRESRLFDYFSFLFVHSLPLNVVCHFHVRVCEGDVERYYYMAYVIDSHGNNEVNHAISCYVTHVMYKYWPVTYEYWPGAVASSMRGSFSALSTMTARWPAEGCWQSDTTNDPRSSHWEKKINFG